MIAVQVEAAHKIHKHTPKVPKERTSSATISKYSISLNRNTKPT